MKKMAEFWGAVADRFSAIRAGFWGVLRGRARIMMWKISVLRGRAFLKVGAGGRVIGMFVFNNIPL